ncbi:unnamed protein product [Diamesa serratosioi]
MLLPRHQNSNIKNKIKRKLIWLVFIGITCYGSWIVGNIQWERYVANPTVISLERDYRDWNGTLPAISLCYHNRIDPVRARNLIKRFWNIENTEEEYPYFYDYITAVVNLSSPLGKFTQFANDKRLEFIPMLTIAKEVHPIINSVISSFDANAEFILNEIITEKGICYCVNSVLSPLLSTITLNQKKLLQLEAKPLSCFFLKNQCYMKLDVYDPTVFVAIHSPFEVPNENSQFFDMGKTDEIESTYNMLETIANNALRKLTTVQRKCLFNDESIENLPVYSYNACNLVCRANAALRLCGCRPYYYPFMSNSLSFNLITKILMRFIAIDGTSCSPSGLLCLSVNGWPKSVKRCGCVKTCAEIVYTQGSLKKINWAVDGGVSFTQKSSFRYEVLAPRLRLRRDVMFSYDDLIVSFGGVAALFLGYNFWSTTEMFYFISSTVVEFIYTKYQNIIN